MSPTAFAMALAALVAAGPGTESITHACAVLHPTAGNKIEGTIHFEQVGKEVKISGRITGLAAGKHGIHVHMFGDCSAPDAASAGDHLNPSHGDHGGPQDRNRHLGDLGNVTADKDGVASFTMVDDRISLEGPSSIIGRSIVIHAKEDDLKSQPSGESGPRLACGVVGIGEPK